MILTTPVLTVGSRWVTLVDMAGYSRPVVTGRISPRRKGIHHETVGFVRGGGNGWSGQIEAAVTVTFSGLGHLAGGDFFSYARGVSADGSVVVGRGTSASGSASGAEAFIWDTTNGMRHLKTALTDYGLDLTGWTLVSAWDVSDDGSTIVGYGENPSGSPEAWMVTGWDAHAVPEPSSLIVWCLIGLSFAGIGWHRRRKAQQAILEVTSKG